MCSDSDRSSPQKPAEAVTRSDQAQKDTRADEFSSFLFWRDPLPKLDSELLSLLVSLQAAGALLSFSLQDDQRCSFRNDTCDQNGQSLFYISAAELSNSNWSDHLVLYFPI